MSDHDDGRSVGSGSTADDELAAQLASVLAGRAASLTIDDRPFDPAERTAVLAGVELDDLAAMRDRRSPVRDGGSDDVRVIDVEVDGPVPLGPAAGRRRWIPWVAAAAAAVILLVALVAVNGAGRSTVLLDDGTQPTPGADTVWVPTRAPDGMQLWDLMVAPLNTTTVTSVPLTEEPTVQLLESGGAQIFLLLGESAVLPDNYEQTQMATVRGDQAKVWEATSPGNEIPPVSPGFEISGTPVGVHLSWSEGGTLVSATMRGMTWQDAVVVLDSLEARDPLDLAKGYDPPGGSTWRLLGEQVHGVPTPRMGALFVFDHHPPTGTAAPELIVQTGSAGSLAPYLRAAFAGTIEPDGRATNLIERATMTSGPAFETVWPDGRSVTVYAADVAGGDTLDTVMGGIEPADLDRARQLKREVTDRLGAVPVVASAELPSGRVEVVGEASPTAVCFTTTDGERTCSSRFPISYAFDGEVLIGQTFQGKPWKVFVASRSPIELVAHDDDLGVGTGQSALSTQPELATDGDWYLGLITAPDGADRVDLNTGNRGWGITPLVL